MGKGLMVKTSTIKDRTRFSEAIQSSDLYGKYNSDIGCFVFPEQENNYEILEAEIKEILTKNSINAQIERLL